MFYEMKFFEIMVIILKYLGGFIGDVYKKVICLICKIGCEYQVYNVDEMDYLVFKLDDGDVLVVDLVLECFENCVEVCGVVYCVGMY